MIKTKSKKDKLAFILYDSFKSPKYYEVKNSFVKFLLILLPTLTILSLLVSCFFIFYFKDIKASLATKEPRIIQELRDQTIEQSKTIETLRESQAELQKKLESPVTPQLATLNLFKPINGRVDRTETPVLSISNTNAVIKDGKLYFTFDLVNTTTDNQRLSGYIFVIYRTQNTIQLYPKTSFNPNELDIPFNRGELFATARFRTTETVFNLPSTSTENLTGSFKILIFSRSGDLLHKEILTKENIK